MPCICIPFGSYTCRFSDVCVVTMLFIQEPEFYVLKEDESPCIFGPIVKQRWSYACAKQLIERLIFGQWIWPVLFLSLCSWWSQLLILTILVIMVEYPPAEGAENGLEFTIVRPFNWIGPRMDFIPGVDGPSEGVPRVLACFSNVCVRFSFSFGRGLLH